MLAYLILTENYCEHAWVLLVFLNDISGCSFCESEPLCEVTNASAAGPPKAYDVQNIGWLQHSTSQESLPVLRGPDLEPLPHSRIVDRILTASVPPLQLHLPFDLSQCHSVVTSEYAR